MFLSVASLFVAFGLAGVLSIPIALKWKPRRAVHAAGSLGALALYYLLVFRLPFHGALTEVPVVLAAGLAWSGPFAAIQLLNQRRGTQGQPIDWTPPRLGLVLGFGLVVPLLAGVMMTLTSRLNHALWLDWAFDGTVTAKTRNKSNHGLPVISIDGVAFEAVDERFWEAAQVGQRAIKQPGSSFATLDGNRVRMLQQDLGWDDPVP